ANWAGLGTGVDNQQNGFGAVTAMAVSDRDLYVGGYFNIAGGLPANHIARWDGRAWSPLGSGLDGAASSLAISGEQLFVAGNFSSAGALPSSNFGLWHIPPRLESLRIDGQWQLSWPTQYLGYALQTNSRLSPNNWQDVPQM